MVTGRRLFEDALREPMLARGWRPRARGWFTIEPAPGKLGVVAATAASQGHSAGTAMVTAVVGYRDEALQKVVAELSGFRDEGYVSRTVSTTAEQLLNRWRTWFLDEVNADEVAEKVAALIQEHGVPWIDELADSREQLLAVVRKHGHLWNCGGVATLVVLLAEKGDHAAAHQLLDERETELGAATGPYADQERPAYARARLWLQHHEQT